MATYKVAAAHQGGGQRQIANGRLLSHIDGMEPEKKAKPPSQRRIGCRIRVKPEHADEAAKLFELNGFAPIYVEHRDDGNISFWFGKATDDELYRVSISIPQEFYALRGIIL